MNRYYKFGFSSADRFEIREGYNPTNWKQPVVIKKGLSVEEIRDENNETDIEAEKNNYLSRECLEIEKIFRRVPKWIKKDTQQINSIILLAFLELLADNEYVSKEELMNKCRSTVKDFNGNFNQLAQFGDKNHGKVFEVNRDEVRLWEPVAKFILYTHKKS